MEISLVQGQAKTVYESLDPDWVESTFTNLKEAMDFAIARGWTAKPQVVQLRNVDGTFIVERYDSTGCGCG